MLVPIGLRLSLAKSTCLAIETPASLKRATEATDVSGRVVRRFIIGSFSPLNPYIWYFLVSIIKNTLSSY